MMSGKREKRRALKFGVRTRLKPHILSLGYERPFTKAVRSRWPEFVPETDFGRIRGATTDFLDIQWDQNGAPKFVMNFAFGPTETLHRAFWEGFTYTRLQSGRYGLPWGLFGLGGVWFGPGQPADAAIDLAIRRVSELNDILQREDAASLAVLVERGFLERVGPGGWWLSHVNTDVPQAIDAFCDWMWRITGSAPR